MRRATVSLLFPGPGTYPSGERRRVSSRSNAPTHARDNLLSGSPRTKVKALLTMLNRLSARSPLVSVEALHGLVASWTKVNQAMAQNVAGTHGNYEFFSFAKDKASRLELACGHQCFHGKYVDYIGRNKTNTLICMLMTKAETTNRIDGALQCLTDDVWQDFFMPYHITYKLPHVEIIKGEHAGEGNGPVFFSVQVLEGSVQW